jgi:hypothetical protein
LELEFWFSYFANTIFSVNTNSLFIKKIVEGKHTIGFWEIQVSRIPKLQAPNSKHYKAELCGLEFEIWCLSFGFPTSPTPFFLSTQTFHLQRGCRDKFRCSNRGFLWVFWLL